MFGRFLSLSRAPVTARFNIPTSIKTTSIKPSGTVSLLAGATPGRLRHEAWVAAQGVVSNRIVLYNVYIGARYSSSTVVQVCDADG